MATLPREGELHNGLQNSGDECTGSTPYSVEAKTIRDRAYKLWKSGFSEDPQANWLEAERQIGSYGK